MRVCYASQVSQTDWRLAAPARNTVTRILLVLYAVGSVAIAVPLLFAFGHAGDLADTTSGKILAAALLAIGFGALSAARDPWRNRVMIQVVMAFTAISSLAIVYRLAFEDHRLYPAWILLPLAVAAPVLLAIFYPRRPEG
jgi:peptidoglycan/LPS O-acetylase OafA/YrhL